MGIASAQSIPTRNPGLLQRFLFLDSRIAEHLMVVATARAQARPHPDEPAFERPGKSYSQERPPKRQIRGKARLLSDICAESSRLISVQVFSLTDPRTF